MVNRRTSALGLVNRWLRALGLIPIGILIAGLAHAAPNDGEAKALSEAALFEDYLNLRFDDAEAKLTKAVTLCASDCTNEVSAEMHRNLGIVLIAGKKDRAGGVAEFVRALRANPGVKLDSDLSTPDVASAFEEARDQVATPATDDATPKSDGAAIEHVPPTEQTVSTPLPLFVGSTAGSGVAKVSAFVRGFGMPDYREVAMEKHAGGFVTEASCADIGATPGEFQYYIVAYNEAGEPIGWSGSEAAPIVVLIKQELEGTPPSLPDADPPKPCATAAPADCPPDFPGCNGGSDWTESEGSGTEEDKAKAYKQHWLSLSFQTDFLLMPASNGTCSRDRPLEWECFEGSTFRNPQTKETGYRNNSGELEGGAGSTGGGFKLATIRVLLGYDYALSEALRLGGRLGFAFGGRPQLKTTDIKEDGTEGAVAHNPFIPVHAEARVAYWFGGPESLVRPRVGLSGGLAQVDAKLAVQIIDGDKAKDPAACPRDSAGQVVNKECSLATVDAWNTTGPGFAAAAVGVMVPLGKNHGIDIEAKLMALFPPHAGLAAALQAGYLFGM